jgi:hypothetical protein
LSALFSFGVIVSLMPSATKKDLNVVLDAKIITSFLLVP